MTRSTKLWIAFGVTFLLAQIVITAVWYLGFKQFNMRGKSMAPSLVPGDRVVVRRTKVVRRGDVVAFYPPGEQKAWINRVIALEGDLVEMRDRQLIFNGVEGYEPYLSDERVEGSVIDFPPYRVANGIFVLGDNRDNANDSRYLGVIPRKNIIGRAVLVISPLHGVWRPRPIVPGPRHNPPERSPE